MDAIDLATLAEAAQRHLGDDGRVLASFAQPSVRLVRGGPTDRTGDGSRLGGSALLGPDQRWPVSGETPLSFLGQIRLDEVAPLAPQASAMPGGLLAFFYDVESQPWGYDPADASGWRVLLVDPFHAAPADRPAGAEEFAAHELAPARGLSAPHPWEPEVLELFDTRRESFFDLLEEVDQRAPGPAHRMFGWPDLIQGSMPLQCQLAANGVYVGGPEGYRDPRVEQLRPGAADWRLLLQIDSDDDVGWMWGDCGRLYYWLREADLREARFDRTWLVLQCY